MENETPADPAAAAEANAIVRDPNHPKHGILHNPGHPQNREVSAYVESLYQRAWPGMTSLDDGVDFIDELQQKPAQAPQTGTEQAGDGVVGPDTTTVKLQVEQGLRADWGSSYDQKFLAAGTRFYEMFPTPEARDAVIKKYPNLATNPQLQTQLIQLLAELEPQTD
jgi:hypothetical protein